MSPCGRGRWGEAAEITVTAVEASQLDGGAVAAFDLEPAGASFGTPLILTAPVAAGPGSVTLAGLVSDGRAEFVEITDLAANADGSAVVSVALPHFSRLVIRSTVEEGSAGSRVEVTPASLPPIFVGDRFELTATIQNGVTDAETLEHLEVWFQTTEESRLLELEGLTVERSESWLSETLWIRAAGPIVPGNQETHSESSGPESVETASFDCGNEGAFTVTADSLFVFSFEVRINSQRLGRGSGWVWLPQVAVSGQCVFGEKLIRDVRGAVERTPPGIGLPTFLARFRGSVVDLSNLPVRQALVTATVTTPDGESSTTAITTDNSGRFLFTVGSEVEGTFTMEIHSITCPDGTTVESSRSASADTPP